jgi:hypothetical protein
MNNDLGPCCGYHPKCLGYELIEEAPQVDLFDGFSFVNTLNPKTFNPINPGIYYLLT